MAGRKREAARGARGLRAMRDHMGVCRIHDKYAYNTKQAAKLAIRSTPCDREVMNAYRCPAGNGWHIGHNKYKGRNDE